MDENSATSVASTPMEGFNQLADTLREAIARFQEEQTPERFAIIVTALSGFGLSGIEVWKTAAAFTRRHPLQAAALAGLAFFALKGLTSSSTHQPRHVHH